MIRRLLATSLTTAFVSALAASGLHAQAPTREPAWGNGHFTVEGFYSQYRLDGRSGSDRTTVDGVGGRLMWQLPAFMSADDYTLSRPRAALGAFAVYTPEQNVGFTTWHVGTQADFLPLATPLFGRVDPLVSLGAGALRTNLRGTPTSDVAVADASNTSFALSPAVGLRLSLLPAVGIRADARDVIAFRGGATHNPELSAGLSLTF